MGTAGGVLLQNRSNTITSNDCQIFLSYLCSLRLWECLGNELGSSNNSGWSWGLLQTTIGLDRSSTSGRNPTCAFPGLPIVFYLSNNWDLSGLTLLSHFGCLGTIALALLRLWYVLDVDPDSIEHTDVPG